MKIAMITTGVLMAAVSIAAQAQILKCVDKNGKIEFATVCPAGTVKQQDTGVANKPVAAPAAKGGAPQSLADRDAEFRKRQTGEKEAAVKSDQQNAEAKDRQRACEAAKSNLQALKERYRMFRVDPKTGERVNYDEADYVRELPVTERLVAENCKAA